MAAGTLAVDDGSRTMREAAAAGKFPTSSSFNVDDDGLLLERCGQCLGLFAICRACYRGQVYCAPEHQERARAAQVRAAKARHRRTPEGRADNRDHNRAWRARKRARVRDHGSAEVAPSGSVCPPEDPPASIDDAHVIAGEGHDDAVDGDLHEQLHGPAEVGPSRRRCGAARDAGAVASSVGRRCQRCLRPGRLVTVWPRRRARRSRGHPGHRRGA